MINSFVNRYQLQKTLQFSLIPVGNTETAFLKNKVLEEDEQRTLNAGKVKGYMDEYHRRFIEQVLSGFTLSDLELYAKLYFLNDRSQDDNDQMDQLEQKMRVQIADAFTKLNKKQYDDLFSKKMIEDVLPDFLEDDEEKR